MPGAVSAVPSGKDPAVGNAAVRRHVVGHDDLPRRFRVRHVHRPEIGRERDAVRAPEIAHERGHLTAGETVDAVEVQLLGRVLVLPYQPEWRIREVQRPAGAEREIVRAVQTLAVEPIHDDGRLTVGADADDLAVEVLRHQHGAAVFGQQAIGADVRPGRRGRVSGRVLDQHLHLSGRRDRSQHVPDDIAEPEPALRRTPQRAFGELEPAGHFLDGGIGRDDGIERRVEPDDGAGGGSRGRRRRTARGPRSWCSHPSRQRGQSQ